MAETKNTAKPTKANVAQRKAAAAAAVRARARNSTSGFMNFIRQQGIIGLAVGLAVGAAAGAAVKSIVDGFISPVIGFILSGVNLIELKWYTGLWRNGNQLVIAWGAVVNALIVLFATALVIYILVHGFRLDKLDKKKDS